jgi:hypothetical protein
VTALETGSASLHLERAARELDWSAPVRHAARRALTLPVLALAAGLVIVIAARAGIPALERAAVARASAPGPAAAAVGALDVTASITPPRYARQETRSLRNPGVVRALEGSLVRFEAAGPDSLHGVLAGAGVPRAAAPGRIELVLRGRPAALRLESGGRSRVVSLEPLADSVPAVVLRFPARDTVFRDPRGTLSLGAALQDDLGLRSAAFEYIVSSGEGETFTFRSGTLGARRYDGERSGDLAGALDLGRLALRPGDVVHLRAVASDARDDTAGARGVSETRAIRIARAGEYDSVAVEAAAPPEADKSLISQRMLINLAEALVKKRRTLAPPPFADESRRIARDQTRLRRQVGEIVFSRLGDDPSGEHFHGDGHEHEGQELRPPLTPDEMMKAAENAAAAAAGQVVDLVHDETPIVAINRPLLEAYNAMWDAGRELEQASPERALPHMYRALAAIQRARAAERLYLRSRPPRAVVDIARVRLTGRERGSPAPRRPREVTPAARALVTRFMRAVFGAVAAPAAAADSLLVLRIEIVDRNPRAAAALADAADALRAGRDATAPMQRVRRALESGGTVADSLARWSGAR